jgi:hypothetical protein
VSFTGRRRVERSLQAGPGYRERGPGKAQAPRPREIALLSRLAPLDNTLVLILVPIWVVCFALGVRTQVRGGGYCAAVGLSVENADRYPALTGEFSRLVHRSDPLAAAGLRAGDRLIRLGDADLRGVGTLGFTTRTVDEARRDLSVPLVFERDGERFETSLPLPPVSILRPIVAASFALAVSALFLLLRGRPTPTVRAYFYLAMCWAVVNSNFAGSGLELYAWAGTYVALAFVIYPLAFHFAFRFPDDHAPEGRWHRIWPWFFAVQSVFAALLFTSWMKIGETGWIAIVALGAVAILAVSTRKYQGAGRVARRQMKWVVFGAYCCVLPLGLAAALSAFDPRFGWLFFASFWVVPLLPFSIVISVLRFNLFDVDRLISGTASGVGRRGSLRASRCTSCLVRRSRSGLRPSRLRRTVGRGSRAGPAGLASLCGPGLLF